ncbi:MAG: hypothetical protein ACRDQ2_10455, partial [Gaiellales bacterium]
RLGAGSDHTVRSHINVLTASAAGGAGDDVIKGQAGGDRLGGGRGADTVYGGGGRDNLGGSYGDDRLYGGRRGDWIQDREYDGGSAGALVYLPGRDTVVGGRGHDILGATRGPSRLFGSRGDDTFCGGPSSDLINGGRAHDIAAKDQTGDRYLNIERITRQFLICN